jgi:hypothetical protein
LGAVVGPVTGVEIGVFGAVTGVEIGVFSGNFCPGLAAPGVYVDVIGHPSFSFLC